MKGVRVAYGSKIVLGGWKEIVEGKEQDKLWSSSQCLQTSSNVRNDHKDEFPNIVRCLSIFIASFIEETLDKRKDIGVKTGFKNMTLETVQKEEFRR